MNVLIIEDEAPAVRRLLKVLRGCDPDVHVLEENGIDSVRHAVEWLQTHPAPDLVLMDIQLSDGNSFEIFDHVRVNAPVIFTTAYDEYALRAFKVNSVDYLLKPIEENALREAIEKYRRLHAEGESATAVSALQDLAAQMRPRREYRQRFLVPLHERYHSIPIEDVLFIMSENKITWLMTGAGKRYPFEATLEKLETELDPSRFFRANRQFIVSYESIAAVHAFFNGKLKVHLRPGNAECVISREKASSFRTWLGE